MREADTSLRDVRLLHLEQRAHRLPDLRRRARRSAWARSGFSPRTAWSSARSRATSRRSATRAPSGRSSPGHSSLELIAIVLSGAAGLRLGLAVIAPGRSSRRKAALVAAAKPAVRVMYGAAVIFLIAAFVEAFWSPQTAIPFGAKIAVGAAGWVLLASTSPSPGARVQPADHRGIGAARGARRGRRSTSASPCCSAGGGRCTRPHLLLVVAPIALALVALGWAFDAAWAAMLAFWWLEAALRPRGAARPLARGVRRSCRRRVRCSRAWREWLGSGLFGALTLDRLDMARSFNLPVRQLEGSRGRAGARAPPRCSAARARGHAVWLTVVCIAFRGRALLWSAGAIAELLLPAGLERAPAASIRSCPAPRT